MIFYLGGPQATGTNSRGEGIVNYGQQISKSMIAAAVASIVMAAGVAAPAYANKDNSASTKTPIKHLVIIFGENESFDHYFGTYPKAKNTEQPIFNAEPDTPGVNGLSAGMLTHNPNLFNPVRLGREDAYTCSFNHDYTSEQKACSTSSSRPLHESLRVAPLTARQSWTTSTATP
jgi:phospholipase C